MSAADSLAFANCLDSLRTAARRDSLLRAHAAAARAGTGDSADPQSEWEKQRAGAYVANFMVDVSDEGNSSKEWAEALYVAAGILVVGAMILYLPKLIYDLAVNKEDHPVFKEVGLRYSYSGSSWDGGGDPLYRHTHLAGGRFTLGIARPYVGLGLTAEGGYLRSDLRDLADPKRTFGFSEAYFLAGPTLRFAPRSPIGMGVDFLNGAGTGEAVGWISQGRFSLQARQDRFLFGVYLGGLFYDLSFLDGLVYRRGSLNRDLTLLAGFETGYAF